MSNTDLMGVLREARVSPIYIKGNFARSQAVEVGMAASLGLITTMVEWAEFSNQWHLTTKGLEVLHAESKGRSKSKQAREK
jgi:hypothetical protein